MKRLVLQRIPPEYYKCPKEIISHEAKPQLGACGNIASCGSNDGSTGLTIVTDAVSGSFQWMIGTFDYLTMNSAAQSANHPVEVTEDYEFDDDAHSRAETEVSDANEHVVVLPTPTKHSEKFVPPADENSTALGKEKEEGFLNNVKIVSTPDPKIPKNDR
jgi:hypothetical protein